MKRSRPVRLLNVDNLGGALTGIAGFGILAIIVFVAIEVGLVALGIWITYTIIWRAVRRGLREYYSPGTTQGRGGGQLYPPTTWASPKQPGPRDW